MEKSTQDLKLTREKIPPDSEAIRIVDPDGSVKFVCIDSPMTRKSSRFYWLGYGQLTQSMRKLFRDDAATRNVDTVRFKRLVEQELVDHQVKETHHRFGDFSPQRFALMSTILYLSLALNAAIVSVLIWAFNNV